MKKGWSNPEVKNLDVIETKEGIVCPYVSGGDNQVRVASTEVTYPELVAGQCCPCKDYQGCSKQWKYKGACNS